MITIGLRMTFLENILSMFFILKNLKKNFFRLQPFKFGTEENDSELELHINWDSTLNLVFPESVMESYRKLFRLAFKLYKARYLLHKYFLIN